MLAPVVAEVSDVRAEARGREQRHAREPRGDGRRRGATRTRPSSLNQLDHHARRVPRRCTRSSSTRSASDRLRIDGLDARRVDLIVAGSMFLATAMELFGLDQLTISEWALREGIVLDAVGRHDPDDWSDDPRAIRRERGPEPGPPLQLAGGALAPGRDAVARALRRTAASSTASATDDRELLEFAALLHDIGEHVASSGTTGTRAYLVRNGQLRGLRPDEIEMLAAIVRWHRRGEPRVSDEFPLLDADAIERVRVLAALLRIADGLDRGRNQNGLRHRPHDHAVARAASASARSR